MNKGHNESRDILIQGSFIQQGMLGSGWWRDDPSQGRLVPEHVPVDNTSLWVQHPCIIGYHVQNFPWMLCPKMICPYFMISASQIFFLQWSQRPSFFRDCMTAENTLSVGNRDV